MSKKKLKKQFQEKLTDQEAMALAIQEAKKGLGFVSPNPPVGCVILNKNREFLSSGFYSQYGAVHAEIMAINKVKNKTLLEGAYLFITLEPCVHFGKNPPCVKNLIKYSWKNIIYGVEDPNPKVSKKGIKTLKRYGFSVKKIRSFQLELKRLYEAFTLNMKEKRAFFALKTAGSLDGVAGLSHGESQWITQASSRVLSQNLRLSFDSVLIGLGTFLQDNPRLNIRNRTFKKANKVILLDPEGYSFDLISQSRLVEVRPLKSIYIVSSKRKKNLNLSYIPIPNNKKIDLKRLSFQLYKKKINSVLVEGGMRTFSEFLQQKASTRLYQFINPSFLGGYKGCYWTETLHTRPLKERIEIQSLEVLKTQPDLFITGLLSYKKTSNRET